MSFTFRQVVPNDLNMIYRWLDTPHVSEFWDNSAEHRDDIRIFAEGRKESSDYFNGVFDYWIGGENGIYYAFFLTSKLDPTEDIPELHKQYLPSEGRAYGVDYCIGEKLFLGQGLGAKMSTKFINFFHHSVDTKANTFMIDPDINNPRAIHVYEKAGFKKIGNFKVENGVFEGHQSILMVREITL